VVQDLFSDIGCTWPDGRGQADADRGWELVEFDEGILTQYDKVISRGRVEGRESPGDMTDGQ
jgi:hypothetical protein